VDKLRVYFDRERNTLKGVTMPIRDWTHVETGIFMG
jgi:hypothetical protein